MTLFSNWNSIVRSNCKIEFLQQYTYIWAKLNRNSWNPQCFTYHSMCFEVITQSSDISSCILIKKKNTFFLWKCILNTLVYGIEFRFWLVNHRQPINNPFGINGIWPLRSSTGGWVYSKTFVVKGTKIISLIHTEFKFVFNTAHALSSKIIIDVTRTKCGRVMAGRVPNKDIYYTTLISVYSPLIKRLVVVKSYTCIVQ